MKNVIRLKGRKVEIWEKSFAVYNKYNQEYYYTGILYTGISPKTKMIENFCDALDTAYEAGKSSGKKDIRRALGINTL